MVTKNSLIMEGDKIILRDQIPEDVDRFIYWQTHGEWLQLDAPWEGADEFTPEKEEKIRQRFLARCEADKPTPRKSAAIVLKAGMRPLGWVNTYAKKGLDAVVFVGIDICEDDALGLGLGSEALSLWIDYLFRNSDFHKICLETWSFNPRMMHVAEKVGFVFEGAEREIRQWQNQWLDLVHYGLLRREWPGSSEKP